MSRKDYKLLANIFKNEYDPECHYYWLRLIRATCQSLKNDNPRFDSDKFMEACNIHE